MAMIIQAKTHFLLYQHVFGSCYNAVYWKAPRLSAITSVFNNHSCLLFSSRRVASLIDNDEEIQKNVPQYTDTTYTDA